MDTIYQSVGKIILNDMDLPNFLVFLLFAYCGTAGNLISDLVRRNKTSKNSPKKASFKYWWSDNKFRLLLSILTTPLAILVFHELFGLQVSKLLAIMIGISADHFWEILKRKNIIANADTKKTDVADDTDNK